MRKTVIALVALGLVVASSAFAANAVRISQVYGGGGSSTASYINDYVELFNSSAAPITITGWAVEYGSSTGRWGSASTNYVVLPAATIPACGYYLIACGTTIAGGAALPITPDLTTTNISAGAVIGKIGLFNALNANVACGSEIAGTLVDKVSYGGANCPEVTSAGAMDATLVAVRALGGMTDSDNNSNDFSILPVLGVTIHNSLSGTNPNCSVVPAMSETWGRVKTLYR